MQKRLIQMDNSDEGIWTCQLGGPLITEDINNDVTSDYTKDIGSFTQWNNETRFKERAES